MKYRKLLRILSVCIGLYATVFAILAIDQRRFIFPGTYHGAPISVTPVDRLVHLKISDGNTIVGLFEPALDAEGRPIQNIATTPIWLYFYGNGGSISGAMIDFEPLRRMGVNIFMTDYPGYGMSSGIPSERACYETANAAYAYVTNSLHIPPSEIVIAGWSLGTGVAIDLASRVSAAGLVTIAAFTNMADEAHFQYPIYPAFLIRSVLKHQFTSDRKIGRVKCPILMIHGDADKTIPLAMDTKLAMFAKAPVTRIVVRGANHVDLFDVDSGLSGSINDFVKRVTKDRNTRESVARIFRL